MGKGIRDRGTESNQVRAYTELILRMQPGAQGQALGLQPITFNRISGSLRLKGGREVRVRAAGAAIGQRLRARGFDLTVKGVYFTIQRRQLLKILANGVLFDAVIQLHRACADRLLVLLSRVQGGRENENGN